MGQLSENFEAVSKRFFYATIGQFDVHPCPENFRTVWKTKSGAVLGITTPGLQRSYHAREPNDTYSICIPALTDHLRKLMTWNPNYLGKRPQKTIIYLERE